MMGRKHLKKLNWSGWTEREVNHLDLYLEKESDVLLLIFAFIDRVFRLRPAAEPRNVTCAGHANTLKGEKDMKISDKSQEGQLTGTSKLNPRVSTARGI